MNALIVFYPSKSPVLLSSIFPCFDGGVVVVEVGSKLEMQSVRREEQGSMASERGAIVVRDLSRWLCSILFAKISFDRPRNTLAGSLTTRSTLGDKGCGFEDY
jgi:hypothetical protein